MARPGHPTRYVYPGIYTLELALLPACCPLWMDLITSDDFDNHLFLFQF